MIEFADGFKTPGFRTISKVTYFHICDPSLKIFKFWYTVGVLGKPIIDVWILMKIRGPGVWIICNLFIMRVAVLAAVSMISKMPRFDCPSFSIIFHQSPVSLFFGVDKYFLNGIRRTLYICLQKIILTNTNIRI